MANWGACEVIEHHREVETDPLHYATKGMTMQGEGKFEEAERAFLNAIKYEKSDEQKNLQMRNLLSMYYRSGRNDFKKKADRLYDGWWKIRKNHWRITRGNLWMVGGFLLLAIGGVGDTMDVALPLFALPLILGATYIFNVKRMETAEIKKGAIKGLASIFLGIFLSIAAAVGWTMLLSEIAQMLPASSQAYLMRDSINFGTMLIGILIAGIGLDSMLRSVKSDLRKRKDGSVKKVLNFIFTIARIAVVIGTIVAIINIAGFFSHTIAYHGRNVHNVVDRDGYFD